jgi:hypothetical protein
MKCGSMNARIQHLKKHACGSEIEGGFAMPFALI